MWSRCRHLARLHQERHTKLAKPADGTQKSAELAQGLQSRMPRAHKDKPQNITKNMLQKLQKEDEDKIREAQDKLKADMESRKAEKQGNQMQFLDKVINPVRKNLPKQRTTADRTGTAAALRFGSGSRTSAATGQSTINKVKREAREASLYGPRKSALSTPTHLLNMNLTHGRIIGPKTINPPPTPAPTPAASRTMGVIAATNSIARVPMHSTSTAARVASDPRPSPLKRAATSVFMPPKRRRV